MAFLPTYFLFPRAPGFIACTAAVSLTLVFSCKEAALEVLISVCNQVGIFLQGI